MSQRGATAVFFMLAFAFTWALQLPGLFARWGWLPGDPAAYLPFAMLGIFGPLVAASILTFKESGRGGLKALFAGLLQWRVSLKWYALAHTTSASLLSAILYLLRAAGREGDWLFLPSAAQLVTSIVIVFAEEVGWRGYALPRLITKYGAFLASSLLGVAWAIWHIPMFLAVGVPMSLAPVMLLFFVGGSFFFTWLYRGSGGSLLIALLAHLGAHLNNSHRALPGDVLPLVVHAMVYAAIGFAAMRSSAFETVRDVKAKAPLRAV